MDEISGESETLGVGALSGRFGADTISDGVNVFGRSFKVFINNNAGVFVFDFGVFEATV